MAGSPNCPECATDPDVMVKVTLKEVGHAWQCPLCQEYFLSHELPEVQSKIRRVREYEEDEYY